MLSPGAKSFSTREEAERYAEEKRKEFWSQVDGSKRQKEAKVIDLTTYFKVVLS